MSDNLLKKTVEGAVGSFSQSGAKIAEAAALPLATNFGTTISDAWFLTFGWVGQLAAKRRAKYSLALKAYESEISEKIGRIPPEKRIEPNTQVVMNALADSQYCVEEPVLRQMFSNLIASASTTDTEFLTHPSFSANIKRMSAFDAELLVRIAPHAELPIVEYQYEYINADCFDTHSRNVLAIDGVVLDDAPRVAASIDVLQSLGLVSVDYQHRITEDVYTPFESCQLYFDLQQDIETNYKGRYKLGIAYGILKMTDLGTRFVAVCT